MDTDPHTSTYPNTSTSTNTHTNTNTDTNANTNTITNSKPSSTQVKWGNRAKDPTPELPIFVYQYTSILGDM